MHLQSGSTGLALVLAAASVAGAAPVEETRYGQAVLRIEARPKPQQVKDAEARRNREMALGEAGVQARWIQIVDNEGGPLINSPFLPCDYPEAEENEAILREWVAEMHEAGMCVMSWYPLTFCKSGWRANPDWRQVYIEPWRPEDFFCCIKTAYGDALIDYCNYAIERLGLDGIWFDGSVWTAIWERPVPLTCACDTCRAEFREDTDLELPMRQDWNDAAFRRWVAWRYREFGDYIGRLAHGIRQKHPEAAIVINHYHRPGIPWQSAVPIDRYEADIISGSEAFSPDTLDLTMRLCRAYGRRQSEVWRPFSLTGEPEENADSLLQHALICYNVGGYPSFGGDPFDPKMAPTAKLMTPIMEAIHPFVDGEAVPYAALHVSQQTETFLFGRGSAGKSPVEPYWSSLGNWTKALGEAHIPPEYLYDTDLTPEKLAPYPVLLMPMSLALTDQQVRTVISYVKSGGTLLLGLGAGQLDQEGQMRARNQLARELGFRFAGVPLPDGSRSENVTLYPAGEGPPVSISGMRTPLSLRGEPWQVLFRYGQAETSAPAAAMRQYGRGRAIVLDVDPAATFASTPVFGGHTELHVSDETAAGGRYALKYVDAPVSPQPFYPDLENRFPPFEAPEHVGGELSCDLKVGAEAHVSIEVRSSNQPIAGPIVGLSGGKIRADGREICDLPPDEWVHVRIAYRFAAGEQPSTYEVTVTLPDGQVRTASATSQAPEYSRTDWLVVYGAGTKAATFYLDNLALAGISSDGNRHEALHLDFEEGPQGFQERTTLLRALAEEVKRIAAPPLEVDAPTYVRVGVRRRGDNGLLVHLHNRNGLRRDWQQPEGPGVTIRSTLPVASARVPISGGPLTVRRGNGSREIRVPSVGLYQVVELQLGNHRAGGAENLGH